LTCHKSQGSEFGSVLVVLENTININTKEGRRWFYTSLTRAKEKIYLSWRPDLDDFVQKG
jgi:ATP-dependent exoDNAse (exonuclease V) alpha subunit